MNPPLAGTLGIDFGTSNSAVSWAAPDGTARLIALEGAALSMPTAVFFNSEELSTHVGRDALAQYLEGTEGRLMRSLKSLLGSPLLLETTEVNHRQMSFQDIIATFLATLRERGTGAGTRAHPRGDGAASAFCRRRPGARCTSPGFFAAGRAGGGV